eukprot:12895139-Prorocentrum_lima.AAC.1
MPKAIGHFNDLETMRPRRRPPYRPTAATLRDCNASVRSRLAPGGNECGGCGGDAVVAKGACAARPP